MNFIQFLIENKRKFKVGDTVLFGGAEVDDKYVLCRVLKLLSDGTYKIKEESPSGEIFVADESDMHHEGQAEYDLEMGGDR